MALRLLKEQRYVWEKKTCFVFCLTLDFNYLAADEKGMTALHYPVKDVEAIGKEYFIDLYAGKPKDLIKDIMSTPNHIETMNQLKAQYPWLNTLIELILTAVRKMTASAVLSFF